MSTKNYFLFFFEQPIYKKFLIRVWFFIILTIKKKQKTDTARKVKTI